MGNTVRWGIIGAGDVCERKSGPPLYKIDGSELVLVHRRNRAAGEDFAVRHGGRYEEQLQDLLGSEKINAVYVASPHHLHAEHTIAALEAGKHVLVEKPMALADSDCGEMIRTARQNGRSLAVAYYRRAYPSVITIKSLIESGAVGTVTGAGINDEFPTSHRIDLIHHLFGEIDSVRINQGSSGGYIFERMSGTIRIRTAGGILVVMNSTWTETGMPEGMMIEGSEGSIYLADLKQGVLLLNRNGGTETVQTGGLPYTHWGIIENFTAHLRTGAPLLCGGKEGRKSTVILDALGNATPDTWERIEY